MKQYPSWTDFDSDEVMYGLSAPFVGIGTYTLDGNFSWPDREGTTKKEYDSWVNHITNQGYKVPDEYLHAYCDQPESPPKESENE